MWYPDFSAGQVLGALGMEFVAAAVGETGNCKEFCYEHLGKIAEATAIVTSGMRENPSAGSRQLMDQATAKSLAAAQAGRAFPQPQLFPTSYKMALTLLNQAEEALKQF